MLEYMYVCSWWLGWAAAVVVVWCRSLLLIMMMIMLTCWWWKRKRQENHHHQQLDSQHQHYYKLNSISPQKWTLFCFREKQSIKTTPRVKSYIYFHQTHTHEWNNMRTHQQNKSFSIIIILPAKLLSSLYPHITRPHHHHSTRFKQ